MLLKKFVIPKNSPKIFISSNSTKVFSGSFSRYLFRNFFRNLSCDPNWNSLVLLWMFLQKHIRKFFLRFIEGFCCIFLQIILLEFLKKESFISRYFIKTWQISLWNFTKDLFEKKNHWVVQIFLGKLFWKSHRNCFGNFSHRFSQNLCKIALEIPLVIAAKNHTSSIKYISSDVFSDHCRTENFQIFWKLLNNSLRNFLESLGTSSQEIP